MPNQPDLRILIVGVAGWNRGDDAIAIISARELKKKLPSSDVTVVTVRQNSRLSEEVATVLFDRRSWLGWKNIISALRQADVVLLGGGTLIEDKVGISILKGILPYVLQIVLVSKILRKKIGTIPIGVNELNSRLGKIYAFIVLGLLKNLVVRDRQSLNNAIKINPYNAKNYEQGSDPAFMFDMSHSFNLRESSRNTVVVCLAAENVPTEAYWGGLLEHLALCIRRGSRVTFVCIDERPDEDLRLCKAMIDDLARDIPAALILNAVEIYPVGRPLEEMIGLLRSSETLITMRLHAAIFAVGYCPIILISRSHKTDYLIERYGLTGVDSSIVWSGGSFDISELEEASKKQFADRSLENLEVRRDDCVAAERAFEGIAAVIRDCV